MSMPLWFDQVFCERLTAALLHFLWQGTAIGALALLGSQLLDRASSRSRYVVHVAAMILMFCCLPVTYLLVTVEPPTTSLATARLANVEEHSSAKSDFPSTISSTKDATFETPGVEVNRPGTVAAETPPPAVQPAPLEELPPASAIAAPSETASSAVQSWLRRAAPSVTGLYLTGVIALLVRLLRGAWASRQLGRASMAVTEADLLDRVRTQAERFGLRVMPALRWCAEVSIPVVIGVLRPIVLLPTSAATGLSMDQLQAVIAHELAHVRRYDLAVNLLQRVIESLLFFHPAVWWISRQIKTEREQACDELVLSVGLGRAQYADALVIMAELSFGRTERTPASALAADGASPTAFKQRVLKVLGSDATPPLRLSRIAGLAAVAMVLLALAIPICWNRAPAEAANTSTGEATEGETPGVTEPSSFPSDPDSPPSPRLAGARTEEATESTALPDKPPTVPETRSPPSAPDRSAPPQQSIDPSSSDLGRSRAVAPVPYQPIECRLVAEESGELIPGREFCTALQFVIPPSEGRPWQLIEELVTPNHSAIFAIAIPDRVLRHPDRDRIELRRYIIHPRLDPVPFKTDGPVLASYRVNEILFDDPRSVRQNLSEVKMRPTSQRDRPDRYDDFTGRLFVLQQQRLQEMGRPALAAEWERLLKDYPEHPERAEAMWHLFSIWENSIPSIGIEPDYAVSRKWLAQAAEAARPDSPRWFEARHTLASRLIPEDRKQAEAIIDEILAAKPDTVREVDALNLRHSLLLHYDEVDKAEQLCRDLHRRMGNARREDFRNHYEMGQFFAPIQTTGYHMLLYWAQSSKRPWPERKQEIDSFRTDFPFRHIEQAYDSLVSQGLIPGETGATGYVDEDDP